MKIALYHPWLKSRGGAERVVLELVKRLPQHEWSIFTNYYNAADTFPEFKRLQVRIIEPKIRPFGFLFRGVLFGILATLTKIPNLQQFDLLIVSTSGIGELITFRNRHGPKIVCFCHTPLRAAHEFYKYYEKSQWGGIVFKIAVMVYKVLERKAWKNFAYVVCNSKNTKSRILKAGLAKSNKIQIIHPGVDLQKFKPTWRYEKYFFVPGRIKKYKRLELAIEAFQRFCKKISGFKLIIGAQPEDKEYFERLRALTSDSPNIQFITSLSDKKLVSLYQNCYAVLFTAKNEDWGLVPLEAMACGKPVIAVAEGGVKESIINGKTGFFVKANPQHICEKMITLAESKHLTRRLGKTARMHVTKFSWLNFVQKFEKLMLQIGG